MSFTFLNVAPVLWLGRYLQCAVTDLVLFFSSAIIQSLIINQLRFDVFYVIMILSIFNRFNCNCFNYVFSHFVCMYNRTGLFSVLGSNALL